MKRILALSLILLMLAACVPTPEEEVVVQKDTDRLVETVISQGTQTTVDEAEPIQPITERFTYDYVSNNGLLRIHADADVQVPTTGKIPMAQVKAVGFTDAFAKQVFDYVYQGKMVYMRVGSPRTKAMISEELKKYQEIANAGTWEQAGFSDAQAVDEYIELLKELYPNAPDELEPMKLESADGSMVVESYYGTDTHKLEIDDELAYLEIQRSELPDRNHTLLGTILSYNRGNIDTKIGYEESGEGLRTFQHWYADYDSYLVSTSDETAVYGQTYTPKEAAEFGLQFFHDLNVTDVAPRNVAYLYVAHPDGVTKSLYLIEYVRVVEGNPVGFIPLTQAYTSSDAVELPWMYESIRVMVDDEGVKSVSWQNPVEITKIISDHVQVMSFDEAATVFKSMCGMVYEPQTTAYERTIYIDLNVEHVELNLIRIREQNAEAKTGLYVPAWLFYGKEVWQYNKRDNPDFSKPFSKILFAINAIDGSIIDAHKGY